MQNCFEQLIDREYQEQDGIFCFGNQEDADFFELSDFDDWQNGMFYNNWTTNKYLNNHTSKKLINEAIISHPFLIDIASGPGMGLIPTIKRVKSFIPCLITDANANVLFEWKKYLKNSNQGNYLDYAQFSIFDIPFKNDSVPAYTSFIGLSSSRDGEKGYSKALSEIKRTLKDDGKVYTIENEWTNIPVILELFEKTKQKPWNVFSEKQTTWHDRFLKNGFEILYEEEFEHRYLTPDDNELGKAAKEHDVDVGIVFTSFVVQKKRP